MNIQRAWLGLALVMLAGPYTPPAQAQATDEETIRRLVEDYVRSWREADVERLAQLFALDEGRVMWISEHAGTQKLRSRTFRAVLAQRRPQPEYGLHWQVLTLDVIDGELAVAKVLISRSGGNYVDLLVWHKRAGAWRIVNKTFVVQTPEAGAREP